MTDITDEMVERAVKIYIERRVHEIRTEPRSFTYWFIASDQHRIAMRAALEAVLALPAAAPHVPEGWQLIEAIKRTRTRLEFYCNSRNILNKA